MTKSGGVLASSVTLYDEKFKLVTFPAGSTPPAWASAQITNPKAWETAPEGASPTPEGQGPVETVSGPETEAQGGEDLPEPPKRGAGSGRDAWVAYATSKGVTFEADATRDEIIDAVEALEAK